MSLFSSILKRKKNPKQEGLGKDFVLPPTVPLPPRSTATIIAKGVKVEGDFASDGDVQIEGEVKGSISTKGRLIVGPEAMIYAGIKAGDASIAGVVQGNIVIDRRADLKSTAKITGDVTAESFSVEVGAVLVGKVLIGQSKS